MSAINVDGAVPVAFVRPAPNNPIHRTESNDQIDINSRDPCDRTLRVLEGTGTG